MKKTLGALAALGMVAYAGPGLAMWGFQELLIFPAPTLDPAVLDQIAEQVGARAIHPVAEDGTRLYGWHRPARGDRAVLFFHGNAETVADRVALQDALVEAGWDVVIVAYRGYPGSEGTPSEAGLRLDARAAWAFVRDELRIPPARVVVHGKSLGGGVSAMLVEELQLAEAGPGALVMESTFLSIADVAKARFPVYPVDQLLKHPFDSASRAENIRCPVLVLHADRDQTIPVHHGRGLGKAFTDVRYVEVPGLGHGETLPIVDPASRKAYFGLLGQIAG